MAIRRLFAVVLAMAGMVLCAPAPAMSSEGTAVRVDTVLADGGEAIWDAADIWVFRTREGQRAAEVARRHATPAEVLLEPGTYEVAVRYRDATAVTPFRVDGDPGRKLRLNLDAGMITLGLRDGVEGPAVDAPIEWTVRRYSPGSWDGAIVTRADAPSPRLILDAGWYEVTARRNGEEVSHTVKVESGRVLTYDIVARQ